MSKSYQHQANSYKIATQIAGKFAPFIRNIQIFKFSPMQKSLDSIFFFILFSFTSIQVTGQVYCDAAGLAGTTADHIVRVQLYDINNGSEQTGYSDFTNLSTDLVQGAAYTIRIFIGFTFDLDTAHAWIDFNQNFTFEDNEKVHMSAYIDNISTGTVSVPAGATLGTTRLRVRNIYSADFINDPCNDYFGEVEDYTINIIEATCTEVGMPCDDGQDCTTNDTVDDNCNCRGDFDDDDYDGVCNEDDQCPGQDDTIDLDGNGIPDLCENYCFAEGSVGTGADWIQRVRIYDLNNPSLQSAYADFTGTTNVELVQGADYTLSIHLNAVFNEDIAYAWIDYNQDFIFQDDEEISMSLYSFTDNTSSGVVSVPADALLGTTRMRVRNIWSPDPVDFPACGSYFGEVEDYSVTIIENNCPNVGDSCDDGIDCTTNDVIDANCNCQGAFFDDDFDGVCNEDDICPGEDDLADLNGNGILDCLDYCVATGLDGTGDDYISLVSVGGVDYPSGKSTYSDFTDTIIIVKRGDDLDISVHLFDVFEEDVAGVWIDFNQNMEFEADEAMEMLDYVDTVSFGVLEIPVDAPFGFTRMRVRNTWDADISPCGAFFGEVEDYTILVDNDVSTEEKENAHIQLFPNPTSEILLIKNEGLSDQLFLEVYQPTGQRIFDQKIISRQHQLSVASWPSGIYFVFLKDADGLYNHFEKLIVN
ncbi:MAG: GEVED domain-containing protein [Bacteroidota bacterium]